MTTPTPDIAALGKRLRQTRLSAPDINGGRRQVPLNPDGDAAADALTALERALSEERAAREAAEAERDAWKASGQHMASIAQWECGRAETAEARLDEARRALKALIFAAQGGNADNDNSFLIKFLADRLQNVHGEKPNVDFIRAARERVAMLDDGLRHARSTLARLAPAPENADG